MTREEFVTKAVRAAEKDLGIPAGWWGTHRDVHSPDGHRVRHSAHSRAWILSLNGRKVSSHDSRAVAILKARRL